MFRFANQSCLVALLLCWIFLPQEGLSYSIEDQYKCVCDRINIELRLNPAYDWGAKNIGVGAVGDCSGKVYAIFSSCGFMVQINNAHDMKAGFGGWKQFPPIPFAEGKKCSLIWFTFPPKPGKQKRVNGHIGILIEDVYDGKVTRMAHTILKTGFTSVPIEPGNYYYRYMSGLRGRAE